MSAIDTIRAYENQTTMERAVLELADRVKALEDTPRNPPMWNKPLVFGPIDPVAYPKTILDPEVIKKAREAIFHQPKPAPAPDLDAKVIDFASQVIRYAPEEMGIYYTDICDLLRAFAADLGYKP